MSASIRWPLLQFPRVFHVGHRDASRKGENCPMSLEGNALSVSLVPEAWRVIARLGDAPVHSLTCPSSQFFLDVHRLTDEHRSVVMTWAEQAGLVRPGEVFEVSWVDGETDAKVFALFSSLELALQEVEEQEMQDQEATLLRRPGFLPEPELHQRIGFCVDLLMVRDMALSLYAEDVLHEQHAVAGLWWADDLDIYAYSAPRGAIHRRAQPQWIASLISPGCSEVFDELDGVCESDQPAASPA